MDLDLIWAVKYGGAWEDANFGREDFVNFVSVLNFNVDEVEIIEVLVETSVTITNSPKETATNDFIKEINSLVETKASCKWIATDLSSRESGESVNRNRCLFNCTRR